MEDEVKEKEEGFIPKVPEASEERMDYRAKRIFLFLGALLLVALLGALISFVVVTYVL